MNVLSSELLGHPYICNPLIGSAEDREVFTASIEAFDCVTYIETILALSRASTVEQFVKWLRLIRYQRGKVDWKRRNHYMTSWIRNNTRAGIVRTVSMPARTWISKYRLLNVVPGFPPVNVRFRCVPKRFMSELSSRIRSGDIVFFASTRMHCDVFHCGIVVREGDRLLLRHASRSRNRVIEQNLSDFLDNHRMSGVIVVRPS
jgi:hypothetical protein